MVSSSFGGVRIMESTTFEETAALDIKHMALDFSPNGQVLGWLMNEEQVFYLWSLSMLPAMHAS
jgi:hypothetical protein